MKASTFYIKSEKENKLKYIVIVKKFVSNIKKYLI